MIDAILSIFDMCFGTAYSFLTLNLYDYSPEVSSVMETINGVLQVIGYSLLVILTLWNVVRSSASYVELKRPETLLRVIVRFILTKYIIGYSWLLVNQVFSWFASLSGAVFRVSGFSGTGSWEINRPEVETSFWDLIFGAVSKLNIAAQIPGMLLSLIAFLVALVLGVTLILTVVGRFFKIYLFAALAPLPLATLGAESTQDVGKSFFKSFVSVSVEGLVIGLAMIIFSAYLQMTSIFADVGFFDWLGTAAHELVYAFSIIFDMMLFLGIIKSTDHVIQRIFGV